MPMCHDSKQNLLPGGAKISKNSPHISDWPLDHINQVVSLSLSNNPGIITSLLEILKFFPTENNRVWKLAVISLFALSYL